MTAEESDIPLNDNFAFAGDSLFCEWVYVIDLDKGHLEVYRGFNKEPLNENDRFYYVKGKYRDDGYFPVKIKVMFSLKDLPSADLFVNICEEGLYEEND